MCQAGLLSLIMLPPPPGAPLQQSTTPGSTTVGPEIVVMPEKYYGLALKMEGKTQAEMEKPLPPKPIAPPAPTKPQVQGPLPHRSVWPFVALIIVLLLLVAGGFVWFNRDLLFKKPTPPPVAPPIVVIAPPNAPSNLTSSMINGTTAVSLAWIDTSGDETGYRLERKEDGATYIPVTNLPANSTSFLDVSVQAGHTYSYRVFAIGAGGESSPSNETSASVVALVPPPVAPTLPPGGLDSDSDGLSDVEEVVFGTDPRVPDTDGDGFLDGNEVFHLYNPKVKAPVNLIDSGLVTPFVSPAGWSIFVPKGWKSMLDAADGSKATILSGQGETFHIEIVDNPQKQSLSAWYLAANPSVTATDPRTITTKGGLEGLMGADRLDAFFSWDGKIFKIVYDNDSKPFINFRTTFEMMLNSLRLSGAPILSPEVVNASLQGPGDFVSTTSTP